MLSAILSCDMCLKQPGSNIMYHRRPLRLHQQPVLSSPALVSTSRPGLRTSCSRQKSKRSQNTVVCASTPQAFDTGGRGKGRLPTQGESVVLGPGSPETMLQDLDGPPADIDYLAVSCCAPQDLKSSLITSCNTTCRSSLLYSKVAQRILDSLALETWGFCTKTS